MTLLEMLFVLYSLGTGIVLGWLWSSVPLKRRILELETRLKWQKALTLAAESDLERLRKKIELSGLSLSSPLTEPELMQRTSPQRRKKAKEKR
jgi:hypothetical protein